MSLIQEALDKTGKKKPEDLVPKQTSAKKGIQSERAAFFEMPMISPELLGRENKVQIPAASQDKSGSRKLKPLALVIFAGFVLISAGLLFYLLDVEVERESAVKEGFPAAQPAETAPSNPFQPAAAKPVKPKYTLTGITTDTGGTRLALINGQIVGVGDLLREGAVVKQIHARSAVLTVEGREILLEL
ncbi:hypothetical protein LDC_0387 [sediment metagenome]|uniref:Uncharacterized protein n=1 Tax=sediment metagenome TaxID=749907 RepID=D9PFU2_9ZZZZ